ncbi:MAG: 4Fe-4S binding protein [Methanomicrobiales archaeon]|nr:4Fe-4S binding protein [Methanomicrobiales archaeon]
MAIEQIPKFIGFIYALVMVVVCAFLWYSGRWNRKSGYLFLAITLGFGFLILAPIMPYQFQMLVLRDVKGIGGPLIAAVLGLVTILALSFLFGRFYCGYFCPVGAAQEAMSRVSPRSVRVSQKTVTGTVRIGFFGAFLLAGYVSSYGLLYPFGIRDFFALSITTAFFVFVVLLVMSAVMYRPFCRLVCPFGALAAFAAMPGIFKIRRTGACIDCGKCERACPTDEAKRSDLKGECYLCGRCTEACPTMGALRYGRA